MAFLDAPYNVSVRGIVGRGRVKHQEFAMASGEMSREAYTTFLTTCLGSLLGYRSIVRSTTFAWTGVTSGNSCLQAKRPMTRC